MPLIYYLRDERVTFLESPKIGLMLKCSYVKLCNKMSKICGESSLVYVNDV